MHQHNVNLDNTGWCNLDNTNLDNTGWCNLDNTNLNNTGWCDINWCDLILDVKRKILLSLDNSEQLRLLLVCREWHDIILSCCKKIKKTKDLLKACLNKNYITLISFKKTDEKNRKSLKINYNKVLNETYKILKNIGIAKYLIKVGATQWNGVIHDGKPNTTNICSKTFMPRYRGYKRVTVRISHVYSDFGGYRYKFHVYKDVDYECIYTDKRTYICYNDGDVHLRWGKIFPNLPIALELMRLIPLTIKYYPL